MENTETAEGFEVIHSYTRAQAIEDGVLVDLTQLAWEAGFRWPVAVTAGVWSVITPASALKRDGQSCLGRAWDLLNILRVELRSAKGGREVSFAPYFLMEPGKPPRQVPMRAVSGPGDAGEPVITVMLPDED
jgi:hypothetical protein